MVGMGDECESDENRPRYNASMIQKGHSRARRGNPISQLYISLSESYLQIRNVVAAVRADSQLEALVILDLKGPGHGDFDGAVPCAFDATL